MRLRGIRLMMGIGLGAAATYLLDPKSGEARRKRLRRGFDRAKKAGHRARLQAGL
jgi:gas vesicle protein